MGHTGAWVSDRDMAQDRGLSSLREIQASVLKLPHREGFTCILYKGWRVEEKRMKGL